MELYETKKLLHNKNKKMVTRLKGQPTEWEKIFGSFTSVRELIIIIYRELKKLKSPKYNDPMKK
jgi:hypothetical protein